MRVFAAIILFATFLPVFAGNEKLHDLEGNPVLMTEHSRQLLQELERTAFRGQALSLPFFEDFYASGPYPDPAKWIGNDVYINSTYPISPPSINVATFDGIRADGTAYSTVINATGFCDSLASQPFNLGGLVNGDDVFLSFFFQSKGNGEIPDRGYDFLQLDFLSPNGEWIEQWRGEADSSRAFLQFFVQVKDSFLFDGFQFRFVRYGSLTGNLDHFHIDYIKLDKERDTIFEQNITDMAYQYLPSPLLKRYYTMPYKHFDSTELAGFHSVVVRNNFINFTTDIVDFWEAEEVFTSTPLGSFSGPSRDFLALTDNPITYDSINIPTGGFSGDSVRIRVNYRFDVSAENSLPAEVRANNQITRDQVFSDYFAYDDGTAELAYRIEDAPGARVAVKYHFNIPDTLVGVKLHVANYNTILAQALFSVVVYKGLGQNGDSDTILYREDFVKVEDLRKLAGDQLNDFSYYIFKKEFFTDTTLSKLVLEGDFYIGFVLTNTGVLNFGFDINTDGSENHFVNYGAAWENTLFNGSIMINPVVGKVPWQLTSVRENISKKDFTIYPNPSSSLVYLKYGQLNVKYVKLVDLTGRVVKDYELVGNLMQVGHLPSGMYQVILEDKERVPLAMTRLVVERR